MRYPCVERTLDVEMQGATVRVWFNVPEATCSDLPMWSPEVEYFAQELRSRFVFVSKDLVEWVAAQPNVSAVQVYYTLVGGIRVGTVVYTVPFGDPAT